MVQNKSHEIAAIESYIACQKTLLNLAEWTQQTDWIKKHRANIITALKALCKIYEQDSSTN